MNDFIKKTFKKSSLEEIKKMKELYENGYERADIARICKRDRSTVIYWTKNLVMKPEEEQIRHDIFDNLKQRIADKQDRIASIELKKSKPLREAKKRQLRKENKCQRCYKKQEKRWIKTNWCGLECWYLSRKRKDKIHLFT